MNTERWPALPYDAWKDTYATLREAVRTSPDPDGAIRAFVASTHAAAADLAKWDRAALER